MILIINKREEFFLTVWIWPGGPAGSSSERWWSAWLRGSQTSLGSTGTAPRCWWTWTPRPRGHSTTSGRDQETPWINIEQTQRCPTCPGHYWPKGKVHSFSAIPFHWIKLIIMIWQQGNLGGLSTVASFTIRLRIRACARVGSLASVPWPEHTSPKCNEATEYDCTWVRMACSH